MNAFRAAADHLQSIDHPTRGQREDPIEGLLGFLLNKSATFCNHLRVPCGGWTRGARGYADWTHRESNAGIEVKAWSQVNEPVAGYTDGCVGQLEHLSHQHEPLVVVTTTARAARSAWPAVATVITLTQLAEVLRTCHEMPDDGLLLALLGKAA